MLLVDRKWNELQVEQANRVSYVTFQTFLSQGPLSIGSFTFLYDPAVANAYKPQLHRWHLDALNYCLDLYYVAKHQYNINFYQNAHQTLSVGR